MNLSQNEEILWQGRRSFKSLINLILLALFLLILSLRLGYLFPTYPWKIVLDLAPFLILLEVVRRKFDQLYTLTNQKVIWEAGLLSLNYRVVSLRLEDLREIKIIQSVVGRFLDFGTVTLGTAAVAKEEIFLVGVADPNSVAGQIRQLAKKLSASTIAE